MLIEIRRLNDLRINAGQEPLPLMSLRSKAERAERLRHEIRRLREDDKKNRHPNYGPTKQERIKELEHELKQVTESAISDITQSNMPTTAAD
jgi:predicted nuclease with TOPRIM domain